MLARNKPGAPIAAPLSLQDRIAALHREIEHYIDARVARVKADGVPREVIKQMLVGGTSCQCRAATKIMADQERDKKIAAQQS